MGKFFYLFMVGWCFIWAIYEIVVICNDPLNGLHYLCLAIQVGCFITNSWLAFSKDPFNLNK